MTQDLLLLSPEKTVLSFRLAGLGPRLMAQILDIAILYAVLTALTMVSALTTMTGSATVLILTMSLWFIGPFLYFTCLEAFWNGQTIGKKAMRLRVRNSDGTAASFGPILIRNLLRFADFLPLFYFAGTVVSFLNQRHQRIGDLAAGTIVILETAPIRSQVQGTPHQEGIHRFEEALGDLRTMTSEEYVALRRLCDRFPEVPVVVQNRLLDDVWKPIARRNGITEVSNVHPIHLAEATVMKYGREHGLL